MLSVSNTSIISSFSVVEFIFRLAKGEPAAGTGGAGLKTLIFRVKILFSSLGLV